MRKIKYYKSGYIVLIVILGILISCCSHYHHDVTRGSDLKKIEVAGVIRNMDDNGWFIIENESHMPLNIDKVYDRRGKIVIVYTFKAATIHSFIVTPDETLSQEGFIAGASVGVKVAVITVSRIINGEVVPVDASTIKSEKGNIWIYGLFSVDSHDS